MKIVVLFILLSTAIAACGQQTGDVAAIQSSKTDKHLNIPGTRIFMIPPAKYAVASNYIGLVDTEREGVAGIEMLDIHEANYFTSGKITKEGLEEKGATVKLIYETTINGFPATYTEVTNDGVDKTMIAFGDSTFVAMVIGVFPANDQLSRDKVHASLRTIWYDKGFTIDPMAIASFRFGDTSVFKFVKFSGGMYVYTPSGEFDETVSPDIAILVMQGPADGGDPKPASTSQRERFKSSFPGSLEKSTSLVTVNGFAAVESVDVLNADSWLYLLVVAKEAKSVLVQGVVRKDHDANIEKIRTFARTLQFK